ncbi:MAG: dynamin family protein [Planctomycetes bacterium]|nr:dynamin family protein [Planctomycetota bacterium]
MKTLLSKFCEEFDGVVRPLVQPLTQAADTLNHVSDRVTLRSVLPTVLDVRHHLGVLADKVAEQQAYVLIFGPLKSGKSTLMNAISAAYVSEVTTLPAYPCMVYVSHSEQVGLTLTRYNGEQETFQDMDSMRTLMEWAHSELAERLREVEARGESFDPRVHCPTAIRRVDVKLPARHLQSSSAALVDTPGLYSRMKFGYDRMTREFRNTASCAIFVVKTDNLFLEQVFDEFGELLKLFSRVFLVVNVDSAKRDLQPGGDLGPSLECKNPDRIITAFENLTMTAPLKQAADEGRLRIYPVDLLKAASARLRGLDDDDDLIDEPGRRDLETFHRFLDDLTDYLNSTDYLVSFLGDSIRQAWGLIDEARGAIEGDAVAAVGRQVTELESEKVVCEGLEHAIARLSARPWDDLFGPLGDDLSSIAGGRTEKLRDQTSYDLVASLDAWFESDGSFRDLLVQHMQPLLAKSRRDLVETAAGVLRTVASTETAGAQLDAEITRDLAALDLVLGRLGKACLDDLDPTQGLVEAKLALTPETVPVRKGFFDYLFFRSQATMRRRVFGAAEDQGIARQVKARKLGEPGRDALQDLLEDAFDTFFDAALEHLSSRVLKLYVAALRKSIKNELRKAHDNTSLRKASVERRLAELVEVSHAFERLAGAVKRATTGLADLSNRYGETDPELLDQPIEAVEGLLAASDAATDGDEEVDETEALRGSRLTRAFDDDGRVRLTVSEGGERTPDGDDTLLGENGADGSDEPAG